MKLLSVFLLAACLSVSARPLAQEVTVSVKNVSLKEVLTEVERQTGIYFAAPVNVLARSRPVTVSVTNMSLQAFLAKVLKEQPILYRLEENTVFLSANTLVSLHADNVGYTALFREITRQTGYLFKYDEETLNKAGNINIDVTAKPVNEVLDRFLKAKGYKYEVSGKTITVREAPVITAEALYGAANAAASLIKGRVTDARTAEPVEGASVVVKGAKQGTTTDKQGLFSISVNPGAVLVISSLGFITSEITVGSITFLNIKLSVSVESMKDIVVTGMYNRKASTFTGSTTTFSQEELVKVSNQNIIQSLKNLDPAFQVLDNIQFGSDPNRMPDIQLRGQSGFPDLNGEYGTNPNLPLFILDGFETSLQKIIDLDPYRVKSATILKDAAAKAIYGARAANGIVVIETIRPAAGKLQITYNGSLNMEAPDLSSYNLTNATEKLQVEDAANIYYSVYPTEQASLLKRRSEVASLVERGVNTDWLAQPVRMGVGQRHSLRLEGGDAYLRYGVDLMYNNVTGAMKGSDRRTTSGAIDLLYRVKNFSFSNVLTVGANRADNSPYGDFQRYTLMNPYYPKTDANGIIQPLISTNVVRLPLGFNTTVLTPLQFLTTTDQVLNPLYNATIGTKDFSNYTDITNNFNVEWSLKKGFIVRGRLGYNKQLTSADQFLPANHTTFYTWTSEALKYRRGRYTKSNGESSYINGNLSLNYTRTFGKHQVFANGGYDISERKGDNQTYIVEGFPSEDIDYLSAGFQFSQDNKRPVGSPSVVRDLGLFGAVNYSWNDRFLADLSYRASESSQFGANNRWGSFWSAGAGWNLHNEKLFSQLGFIQQLRIRGSTGYTGSQGFSSYMSYATYSYIFGDVYANGNGAKLISLANPELRWQQKRDNNIGIDLSLFNKVDVRADYYIGYTDGLITDITLPPSAGFATYKANLGKTQNEGIELRLNYKVFSNPKKRNSLSVFATLAHNKNTLKEISNSLDTWNDKRDAESSVTGTVSYVDSSSRNVLTNRPKVRYVVNQSMNAIWAVPSMGIDPATGAEVYKKRDGSLTTKWDPADQVVAGDNLPKFNGNFGFNFILNGWQLSSSFMYRLGGQMYNQTLVDKVENANIYQNVDKRVLTSRWRKPGDISFFKNVADYGLTQPSTRFVMDWNMLTFSSLNLSYDLDKFPAVRQLGFRRLRIGAAANDLFTWSSVQVERGTAYPFARRFSFSLQAMF
ncbi:SusC/RagA family TonB-linked outer membrane protein [Filimonas effusa]|nr:SusC/RagA family TonB-linked outer membrane protein [Filimonas effusa]